MKFQYAPGMFVNTNEVKDPKVLRYYIKLADRSAVIWRKELAKRRKKYIQDGLERLVGRLCWNVGGLDFKYAWAYWKKMRRELRSYRP